MPNQSPINQLVSVVHKQKNLGVRRPIEGTFHPGQLEMHVVMPYLGGLSVHTRAQRCKSGRTGFNSDHRYGSDRRHRPACAAN